MRQFPVGAKGSKTTKVTEDTLASFAGSGDVDVFSTPRLVLLMEEASCEAVGPFLCPDQTTVGTMVSIRHLAPTPLGGSVTATAVLMAVDGRRLMFDVTAYDDWEKVGEGTHERFLVNRAKFTSKSLRKVDIHKENHI